MGVLHVEYGALGAGRSEVVASGAMVAAGLVPLAQAVDAIQAATGELAADISSGTGSFESDWRACLGELRDTCAVLADAVQRAVDDYAAADTGAAVPG